MTTTRHVPLALLTCWLLLRSLATAAEPPWAGEPFAAEAKAILAAAKELAPHPQAPIDVFYQHVTYRFDAAGREQRTAHRVWRCQRREAVQAYAMLEADFSPWHERRPKLEARVISPDGSEQRLDPALVAEISLQAGQAQVLTDRKLLRAPLPALEVGSIVEQRITFDEDKPALEAGIVERYLLGEYTPLRKLAIRVIAPASLSVQCQLRASSAQVARAEESGQVTFSLDLADVPPLAPVEVLLPTTAPRMPSLDISTGRSWQAVAAGYAKLVEQQRADERTMEALVRQTLRGGESRTEAAAKLTARVQQLVRYTSVAFGQSAIVPYKPQETLSRRFGDCKDQSALLVALLRAAGHPAHVALLRVGSREDLPEASPGLGLFDHCIVYVPGEPELWIDPVSTLAQPLELPLASQGRLALVAREQTTALVRTPQAPSSANLQRERRELFLRYDGWGLVRETIEADGTLEAESRSGYQAQNEPQLRAAWEEYARTQYAAKKLKGFSYSDPHDKSQPFVIKTEIEDAALASGQQHLLQLRLGAGTLFDRLPPLLWTPPNATVLDAAGNPQQSTPRKGPLTLVERHRKELAWRIVPPRGYAVKDLPASERRQWGPATLTSSIKTADDGAIEVELALDTGSGEFTAAEVEAMRKGLSELAPGNVASVWSLPIALECRPLALMAEGKHGPALQEYRKLLAAHPAESWLRWQYAESLTAAGFGAAGRQQARQNLAAEPDSAMAHISLAFVLLHDELGRNGRTGFEPEESAGEYQRAVELAPDNWVALYSAAQTLEFDRSGNRRGNPERLRESGRLYGLALEKNPLSLEVQLSLALALIQLDDRAGLRDLADKLRHIPLQRALLVYVAAVGGDVGEAEKVAAPWSLDAAARQNAFQSAANYAERTRRYALAADLLEAAGRNTTNEDAFRRFADGVRRVKKLEDVLAPESSPLRCVQELLAAIAVQGPTPDALRPLAAFECLQDRAVSRVDGLFSPARQSARTTEMPADRRRDVVSIFQLESEGTDETGYRVSLRAESLDGWRSPQERVAVVRRPEGFRVAFSGLQFSEYGRLALEHLDAGRSEAATQWLTWARTEQPSGFSFLGTFNGPPFVKLWSLLDRKQPEQLRVLAAALLTDGQHSSPAIPILETELKRSPADPVTAQLRRVLVRALRMAGRYDEALAVLDELAKDNAAAELEFSRLDLLRQLRKHDLLLQRTRALCEKRPTDAYALFLLADAQQLLGNYAAAQQTYDKAAGLGELSPELANGRAWNALFLPTLPETALKLAEEATAKPHLQGHHSLHTLACIQAEVGQPTQAMQTLRKAVEASPGNRLSPADWYVIGRVAEAYGLSDIAGDAYARVQADENAGAQTILLAQKRLKGLPR